MKTQKTKKSFKKKALLSSLSMLMVATVAVGSATFAWFTSNKKVTADGMSVKAAAATGLQITGNNGQDFNPTYTFTAAQATLSPISVHYSNSAGDTYDKLSAPIYPASSKKSGQYSETDATLFESWTEGSYPVAEATSGTEAYGNNGNFALYEVGIKSTATDDASTSAVDESKIEDVRCKVTLTETPNKEYLRVAVIKQAGTALAPTTDTVKMVYGNESSPKALANKDSVTEYTEKLDTSTSEFVIGDVTSSAQYYSVLVWFEGQDAQCVDTNQQLTGSVQIEFFYD